MAIQYSIAVNNARLDAIESAIGVSPLIEFRSGAKPANCAAARTGTLLAQGNLPADWMSAAAAASKAKLGTWTMTGIAAGTIGYYTIYDAASPNNAHMQGSVTETGGGGDMTVDNDNIEISQVVTVTGFTINAANT